jgi:hypothetical protein
MVIRNKEIRDLRGNVPNWLIAEKLGVHENTVYRLLQKPLTDEKKQRIIEAIEQAKSEFNQG